MPSFVAPDFLLDMVQSYAIATTQQRLVNPHMVSRHDYHKIMQHVLPIALRACDRNARIKALREVVYEMSTIFRYVTSIFKGYEVVNCLEGSN
jgi:hypothetical protein